jgi:hypothetical protein
MAHVRASFLVAVLSLSWFVHGTARAEPIPARPAVVRGNVWHLRNTLTPGFADIVFSYGRVGDRFLMGDWDGDGVKTPGAVRGNTWYLRNSNTSGFADVVLKYGFASDVPIAGDWDGNGTDTVGVFRPFPLPCQNTFEGCRSSWHLRNENSTGKGDINFDFSRRGVPIVGDWDGDGDDTPGLRFEDSNRWDLSNANATQFAPDIVLNYGSASFIPIAGDWDGDERESIGAVGEGNVWFLKNENTSGTSDTHFRYGHWRGDIFLVWGESTA